MHQALYMIYSIYNFELENSAYRPDLPRNLREEFWYYPRNCNLGPKMSILDIENDKL